MAEYKYKDPLVIEPGAIGMQIVYHTPEDREAFERYIGRENLGRVHGPTFKGDHVLEFVAHKHLMQTLVRQKVSDWVRGYNKFGVSQRPAPQPLNLLTLVRLGDTDRSPARYDVYAATPEAEAWFFENAPRFGKVTDHRKSRYTVETALLTVSPNYDPDEVAHYLESFGR